MAAAAIIDFGNREILLADGVQWGETYQCAKFRQNRSIRWGGILQFFKMAAVRYLEFVWDIWTTHNEYSVVFVTVQNLVAVDAVVSIT